jgi:hypothetical protein
LIPTRVVPWLWSLPPAFAAFTSSARGSRGWPRPVSRPPTVSIAWCR